LVLHYTENTNGLYANIAFKPVKRVTLRAGINLTTNSGNNLWLRGDNGQPLLFAVDPLLNIVTPGSASAVAIVPGPNPLVPLGPQAFYWEQPYAGVEIPLGKGLAFNGIWNYYDYNEKNAFQGPGIVPREFHTNLVTLALKYSF
jgi:hypothetical protein